MRNDPSGRQYHLVVMFHLLLAASAYQAIQPTMTATERRISAHLRFVLSLLTAMGADILVTCTLAQFPRVNLFYIMRLSFASLFILCATMAYAPPVTRSQTRQQHEKLRDVIKPIARVRPQPRGDTIGDRVALRRSPPYLPPPPSEPSFTSDLPIIELVGATSPWRVSLRAQSRTFPNAYSWLTPVKLTFEMEDLSFVSLPLFNTIPAMVPRRNKCLQLVPWGPATDHIHEFAAAEAMLGKMRSNLVPPPGHPITPFKGPLYTTPRSKAATVTTAAATEISQLLTSTQSLDLLPYTDDSRRRGGKACDLHESIPLGDVKQERMSVLDGFKVEVCRNMEQVHDRKVCPFYHNHRDRRRYPITYEPEQCSQHFDIDTFVMGCDKGDDCGKCHSRLELLQRFCATWPNIANCVRAGHCASAHDRSEINGKMFTEDQEATRGIEFFVNHFKTLWCPYGVQHDWHRCYYAHTYQDCRRSPALGYGSEPCPYWSKSRVWAEYSSRCPNSHRCPYSHGSKEQLYHPSYYKTMPCCDWKARGRCPRGELCAFYHDARERRQVKRVLTLDYNQPLSLVGDQLQQHQPHFWRPPLFSPDDTSTSVNSNRGSLPRGGCVATTIRARSYSSSDSDASSTFPTTTSASTCWSPSCGARAYRSDTSSVTTTAPGSTERSSLNSSLEFRGGFPLDCLSYPYRTMGLGQLVPSHDDDDRTMQLHPQLCPLSSLVPIFLLPPSVSETCTTPRDTDETHHGALLSTKAMDPAPLPSDADERQPDGPLGAGAPSIPSEGGIRRWKAVAVRHGVANLVADGGLRYSGPDPSRLTMRGFGIPEGYAVYQSMNPLHVEELLTDVGLRVLIQYRLSFSLSFRH
ncbi:hypothetical protein FOZ60_000862 [Perkinsus olseni]|uniref:C3H1-type domain-containing protein n=1 Tax=Perkinsus olseni TaxID=32597 RepID=A0A7J6PJP8_PEROL|nr:hypothetical protein FOZ60_000862 [Perkinsus olseni]